MNTVQPDPSDVGAEPSIATSPPPLAYPPPDTFWPESHATENVLAPFAPTLVGADLMVARPAAVA